MFTKRFIMLAIFMGTCSALTPPARAQFPKPVKLTPELQKAWDALPKINYGEKQNSLYNKSYYSKFNLDNPIVSQFCLAIIKNHISPQPIDPRPNWHKLLRVRGIIWANGPIGCLWTLEVSRHLNSTQLGTLIFCIPPNNTYQETLQLLIWDLRDTREILMKQSLHMSSHRPRVCDKAYNCLIMFLTPLMKSSNNSIAKKFSTMSYYRSDTTLPQRDKLEEALFHLLQTQKIKKIIQQQPSAILELRKKGYDKKRLDIAASRLGRIKPFAISDEIIKGLDCSFQAVAKFDGPYLKNWPPEKPIQLFTKPVYTAKDIAIRLPRAEEDGRSHMIRVMMARKDRENILRELTKLARERTPQRLGKYYQMMAIEALGLVAASYDPSKDKQTIAAALKALKEVQADPKEHWAKKVTATEALELIKNRR